MRGERVRTWDPAPFIESPWRSGLDDLAGADRRVVRSWTVTPLMARFELAGGRGTAFVTVRFDEHGRLDGIAIDLNPGDGIRTVVLACDRPQVEAMRAFYGALVKAPLRFGEAGGGHRPPRWPDPEHPQQVHLDLEVDDVEVAGRVARAAGGAVLVEAAGHVVVADPAGHPVCLYPAGALGLRAPAAPARSPAGDAPPGRLARIVFDCPDPEVLADFYADLPQQVHVDMAFDDAAAARTRAEALGAVRLPPAGGSCPVYADPAGHPFCLCMPGE